MSSRSIGRLRVAAAFFVSACGSRGIVPPAEAPSFDPAHESKCQVTKDRAKPLVVEWPASARGDLEAHARSGVIVVRYSGCAMDVLDACTAPGKYKYEPFTPKEDRVRILDATSLYANLPVGAPRLEAKLAKSGELDVAMTIVGRYAADHPFVRADELSGACNGATHVLVGLTAGAFDFFAGGDVEAGASVSAAGAGAGGLARERRETLSRDGDPRSCARWTYDDRAPPAGCGAVLRVETLPIMGGAEPPRCPEGATWDGARCKASRVVVTTVECPEGAKWNGWVCVGAVACPSGAPPDADGQCREAHVPTSAVRVRAPAPAPARKTPSPPQDEDDDVPAVSGAPVAAREPAGTHACSGTELDDCRVQCDRGNAPSCNSLGEMYRDGRGVARDAGAALVAFTDACIAKSARACANIGRAYDLGDGIEKDVGTAQKWYSIACRAGWAPACR